MRIFGLEINWRRKAPVQALSAQNASALMPFGYGRGNSWLQVILEPFTGAWQRNMEAAAPRDVLAFSAVYTCISLIAGDISKLRIKLVEFTKDNIWQEVRAPNGNAFRPVLDKPNSFQTRIQFLSQWVISKLIHGNAYILKRRDLRGVVNELIVLDPRLVTPLILDNGEIYYLLKSDAQSLHKWIGNEMSVPASDIIHDTMNPLWHPLVGVSPIYACGASAMQGMRIQADSEKFFASQSRPSGVLTVPGDLSQELLDETKNRWEENYGPGGKGGTAVLSNGITFSEMRMSAVDAQMIEQLKWTVEDVGRCFHVPLHMLGVTGSNPSYNNIGALNQAYYSQTLQILIESIELLLDEGLGLLEAGYGAELDLASLVRMDPAARAETSTKMVGAGIWKIDEARAIEDMAPVEGGDTPYLQQQNYSLAALARRDENETPTGLPAPQLPAPSTSPPSASGSPPADTEDDAEEDDEAIELSARAFLLKEFEGVVYA